MTASDHVISIRYCDWLSAALQNGCANKEHQTNYSQSGGVNSHSVNYLGFTSFLTNIVVTNIFKCKFYIHMIRKKVQIGFTFISIHHTYHNFACPGHVLRLMIKMRIVHNYEYLIKNIHKK